MEIAESQQGWWNRLVRPYPGASDRICDRCNNRITPRSLTYDDTTYHFEGICKTKAGKTFLNGDK